MDKKLNELNKLYNKINIPEDLDRVIEDAINRERNNKVVIMKPKNKLFKTIVAAAASLVLLVGLTVNMSYAFAQEIYKVPIIGELAKMMTIREYTIENDTSLGKVTIPNVEVSNNKVVEALINDTIKKKVDEIVAEQAILDAEYKEAYLETGGTEEDYRKVEMTVDYQLHYVSDDVISFEISKYQTLAPAYNEKYIYNVNLKTGKELKLKDVIKSDYKEVKDTLIEEFEHLMASNEDEIESMKESLAYTKQALLEEDNQTEAAQQHIKATIEDIEKTIENEDFNQIQYDIDYVRNMDINDDRMFYVKENGDVVFIFSKYEIASGSVGEVQIVVGSINDVRFPEEVTIIGEEIYSVDAKYICSTSNTIMLNINDEELTLQSMQKYDYKKDELLKVKYVLEDGKTLVMLQCYPASNKIDITVEKLRVDEEEKIIIEGKASDGTLYTTSINPGVKVNSYKENLEIGNTIEIYYDFISDDAVKNIVPYVITVKE